MAVMYYHSHILPWTVIVEEVRRFRKILKSVFIVFIVLSVIIPFIPVPKVDRSKEQELPPRLAKLILEKKKPKPKPVVIEPKKEKKKEIEKKKVEKKKEKPKPKPKKKVEKKKEPPKKPVIDLAKVRAKAREKAAKSGLLAMMDDLSDLRESPEISTKKLSKGATKARKTAAPQLLTSNVSGSGGISAAALKRATIENRALGSRDGTVLESPVDAVAAEAFANASDAERTSPRSLEEIQLIFDRYKGAITRMYNRALRKDASLRGIVLLEITISPGGAVVACKAVSSDLDAPELVRKLVARVKTFKFKAKDVDEVTIRYPVDFTPIS